MNECLRLRSCKSRVMPQAKEHQGVCSLPSCSTLKKCLEFWTKMNLIFKAGKKNGILEEITINVNWKDELKAQHR